MPLERVAQQLADGHLQGLSISASSYASGEHVTFYQANAPIAPWTRAQRRAVPVQFRTEHLLASSAIPFIFPAGEVQVDGQTSWYGDGSMRQVAPISPAIHLGADRVLVIGAGRASEPPGAVRPSGAAYPSLAQVAGHALSSIFLDTLSADVERTQRINHTLSLVPPEALARSRLRPVDLLVIWPSQRLDDLAAQHVAELPPAVRALLGILGVQPGDARTGAGQLPAVRAGLYPGADATGLGRHPAPARRGMPLLWLGRPASPRQGRTPCAHALMPAHGL